MTFTAKTASVTGSLSLHHLGLPFQGWVTGPARNPEQVFYRPKSMPHMGLKLPREKSVSMFSAREVHLGRGHPARVTAVVIVLTSPRVP